MVVYIDPDAFATAEQKAAQYQGTRTVSANALPARRERFAEYLRDATMGAAEKEQRERAAGLVAELLRARKQT